MASMVVRDPSAELAASWQRDIERMFRSIAESFGGLENVTGRRSEWLPAADILTRGDDLVIRLELPGIDPERDLEITAEDGLLRIRGQKVETDEEREEGYIRRETSFGAFERALRLPTNAKTEDLKATYNNGILEVVVPGAMAKRETQRVPVELSDKTDKSDKKEKKK
jgi:HSP20 family protein